jgi:hypothetical protein
MNRPCRDIHLHACMIFVHAQKNVVRVWFVVRARVRARSLSVRVCARVHARMCLTHIFFAYLDAHTHLLCMY